MTDTNHTGRDKHVVIVTATVGSGHNQVAKAIANGLASASPSTRVTILDSIAFAPRWFRACYAGGFSMVMTRFPKLFGLGFVMSDRSQSPRRSLSERSRLKIEQRATQELMNELRVAQPDLIINTHFLAPPQIARLIDKGELGSKQWVIVTDYQIHRFWHSEGVAKWFIPTAQSSDSFSRWGIDPDRVTVSGLPIDAKWTQPVDRDAVLDSWSIPADKKIVLLSGGTEFTCGPVVKIARKICQDCRDVAVVVLAGRNKNLLAQLAVTPEAGNGQIFPVSFTDRVNELVSVSSLMVTKPGGVTVTECLARSVPMVLTNPVPGHERGNAEFLSTQGAAVIARGVNQIASQVRRLIDDPQALDKLAAKAGELARPGLESIVNEICQALE